MFRIIANGALQSSYKRRNVTPHCVIIQMHIIDKYEMER